LQKKEGVVHSPSIAFRREEKIAGADELFLTSSKRKREGGKNE